MLLYGGRSAEHSVSRVSAQYALAAMDPRQYEVVPVAVTKDGSWLRGSAGLASGGDRSPGDQGLLIAGEPVSPTTFLQSFGTDRTTVVFPLLHGPYGEDGTIQGLLELVDVPYIGSGVLASALAMDKAAAKTFLTSLGVDQVEFRAVNASRWTEQSASQLVQALGLPVFVKPSNMGSSIGVSLAESVEEVDAAAEEAFRYDESVVVESAVVGAREIEVAILGNLDPRASVPGEIRPGAKFYDYQDKYSNALAELVIPADLDNQTADSARSIAVRVYSALGCEGLARVDFLLEPGSGRLLLNEVNTMPGFTPISMYPKLWESSGLPYARLVDELVSLALERHGRRSMHRRLD